jgi:hypothetical protein
MEESVVKVENGVAVFSEELKGKLKAFQGLLHTEPLKEEIQVNPAANNSRYIPISFLEMELDEMFGGLWSTKNFTSRTVANEEIGSIELWYFHPIAQTWLCRIGAGAVMIQFKKDSEITDLSAKIKNTLTKDYPHLKAECFRNACQSLGKKFGRDLNRKLNDQYNPFEEPLQIDEGLAQELSIRLKEFSLFKDLYDKSVGLKDEFVKKGLPLKYIRIEIKDKLEALRKK